MLSTDAQIFEKISFFKLLTFSQLQAGIYCSTATNPIDEHNIKDDPSVSEIDSLCYCNKSDLNYTLLTRFVRWFLIEQLCCLITSICFVIEDHHAIKCENIVTSFPGLISGCLLRTPVWHWHSNCFYNCVCVWITLLMFPPLSQWDISLHLSRDCTSNTDHVTNR